VWGFEDIVKCPKCESLFCYVFTRGGKLLKIKCNNCKFDATRKIPKFAK